MALPVIQFSILRDPEGAFQFADGTGWVGHDSSPELAQSALEVRRDELCRAGHPVLPWTVPQ